MMARTTGIGCGRSRFQDSTLKDVLDMFYTSQWSADMAEITYFVVVPFQESEDGVVAEQGIQCPSERSAMSQARNAVAKGAIGAIAFKRSGDPGLGEYGEAVLICKEGELPDSVMEMLAA
jgi:hypothetical protein